jgi:hypothetical protein
MDQQLPEEDSRALFFARCPPTLPQHELLQLFGKFGHITSFNLYRRWAKAKNSKGCGTVVYADKVSADAALAALDRTHQWPESETPMVVERAQASKMRNQAPAVDALAGEAMLHHPLHYLHQLRTEHQQHQPQEATAHPLGSVHVYQLSVFAGGGRRLNIACLKLVRLSIYTARFCMT